MKPEADSSKVVFNRVKGILRSLGLNQQQLAQKLGLAQGVVSLALNGGNEKTFGKIVTLLMQEYGVEMDSIYGETEPGNKVMQQLEAIKQELNRLNQGMEDLKEMIGRLER